jgi:hypothetical protein
MPFKGVDVMDVKKEFVLKALDDRVVFTELCREYGISARQGKIKEDIFEADADSGTGIRRHNVLQGNNALYAKDAEESKHTMDIILRSTQYREI